MSVKELEWVDYLKKRFPKGRDVSVGIGDDCAQVKLSEKQALLKSDLFIEGIHFKRADMSFRTIGIRAVTRQLSDFAACGGRPRFIGVSAGIPKNLSQRDLRQILAGIHYCVKKYNFSLVGGDTSRADKLFLDVWGLGETKKCILRSKARIGDYIFITGPLGRRRLDRPFAPRLKEAKYICDKFKINAMIDISDGCIIDLYRILAASSKGAVLYEDKLPLHKGEADLYRGEDYELIFTVDKRDKNIDLLKDKFFCIGRIMPKAYGYKMKGPKTLKKLKPKGYTHF